MLATAFLFITVLIPNLSDSFTNIQESRSVTARSFPYSVVRTGENFKLIQQEKVVAFVIKDNCRRVTVLECERMILRGGSFDENVKEKDGREQSKDRARGIPSRDYDNRCPPPGPFDERTMRTRGSPSTPRRPWNPSQGDPEEGRQNRREQPGTRPPETAWPHFTRPGPDEAASAPRDRAWASPRRDLRETEAWEHPGGPDRRPTVTPHRSLIFQFWSRKVRFELWSMFGVH